MTTYKINVTAHYQGDIFVDAESEDEALEYISSELPSWLSIDADEIDYWGAELEVVEGDEG